MCDVHVDQSRKQRRLPEVDVCRSRAGQTQSPRFSRPLTTTVAFVQHLPRAIEHTRRADPDVPLLRVNDGRATSTRTPPRALFVPSWSYLRVLPHGASTRWSCCRSPPASQHKSPRDIREMQRHNCTHPSSVSDRRILLIRRKLWLPACSHIWWRSSKLRRPPDADRTRATRIGQLEPEEAQHQLEGLQQSLSQRLIGLESGDVVVRQYRRRRAGATRLRQRKQPLNVIVIELELVEVELVDVAQRSAAMIAAVTSIERHECAVSQSRGPI